MGCTYHVLVVQGASRELIAFATACRPLLAWPTRTVSRQSSGRKGESGEDGNKLHDDWWRWSLGGLKEIVCRGFLR